MTARGLPTWLASSLVLAVGMVPWIAGQTRDTGVQPLQYGVRTPDLSGLNMYHYLGPIAPYAPGFFPVDVNSGNEWYSGQTLSALSGGLYYNPYQSLPSESYYYPYPSFPSPSSGSYYPYPPEYPYPDYEYVPDYQNQSAYPYQPEYVYPPPFYGGYYSYPSNTYPPNYGYSYGNAGNSLAWQRYMRFMHARPNAQAPTEVQRIR